MPRPHPLALRPLALALLATAAHAQPAADVPVERVILFTSGVGYFEHAGRQAEVSAIEQDQARIRGNLQAVDAQSDYARRSSGRSTSRRPGSTRSAASGPPSRSGRPSSSALSA